MLPFSWVPLLHPHLHHQSPLDQKSQKKQFEWDFPRLFHPSLPELLPAPLRLPAWPGNLLQIPQNPPIPVPSLLLRDLLPQQAAVE